MKINSTKFVVANRIQATVFFLLIAITANAQSEKKWLRSAEIFIDPLVNGKQDYSIRITPGLTYKYDILRFECVYRQEYEWENSLGEKETKVVEPVTFIYDRKDIKLTDDLDSQISFQVPIDTNVLRERFGKTTFKENVPVTVNRIKIIGMKRITADSVQDPRPVWGYEVPNKPGIQQLPDKSTIIFNSVKTKTKLPGGKKPKLGEIDLD